MPSSESMQVAEKIYTALQSFLVPMIANEWEKHQMNTLSSISNGITSDASGPTAAHNTSFPNIITKRFIVEHGAARPADPVQRAHYEQLANGGKSKALPRTNNSMVKKLLKLSINHFSPELSEKVVSFDVDNLYCGFLGSANRLVVRKMLVFVLSHDEMPPNWEFLKVNIMHGSNSTYAQKLIADFQHVVDLTRKHVGRCENHWAASYIIHQVYNNLMKNCRDLVKKNKSTLLFLQKKAGISFPSPVTPSPVTSSNISSSPVTTPPFNATTSSINLIRRNFEPELHAFINDSDEEQEEEDSSDLGPLPKKTRHNDFSGELTVCDYYETPPSNNSDEEDELLSSTMGTAADI